MGSNNIQQKRDWAMAEAEDDGGGGADGDVLSFTLHLDKSVSCAVSISIFLPLSPSFYLQCTFPPWGLLTPGSWWVLGFWVLGFFSEGENSSMESREGFAGHGHTRSPTPCAPIQLAASLGRLSRSKSYSNLLASWWEGTGCGSSWWQHCYSWCGSEDTSLLSSYICTLKIPAQGVRFFHVIWWV